MQGEMPWPGDDAGVDRSIMKSRGNQTTALFAIAATAAAVPERPWLVGRSLQKQI